MVHFSQVEAIDRAQNLMSINVCTREEKDKIAELIAGFRFAAGFGKTLNRLVRHGIGVHHAGMLPKYRRLVEQLAQAGLLKVICGTDTLGVGINVPIRTVLLTALSKYDGVRTRLLQVPRIPPDCRPGRAGRLRHRRHRGGPGARARDREHEGHGQGAGEVRRRREEAAPGGEEEAAAGLCRWGEPTFKRLAESVPEPLTSSFTVTHAMLLNLLERPGDPFLAARKLLTENHESPAAQRQLIRKALGIYRELLGAGIVERIPADELEADGRTVRLTVHLQPNFALNQPLSPFALAALELLDPESPRYALDAVSVIEATLEKPRQILSAQHKKARGEAVAAMKAEGIEYDQRMAMLDEVTYPQPLAEMLLRRLRSTARPPPGWATLSCARSPLSGTCTNAP